ncbi:MAG: hypothetical protein PSV22_03435, partial [Pseudolabrys sp.]|nr:hypothetical protein [Pseudolabrys sp.]
LNLTIYRHAQAAVEALGANVLAELSKSERVGWEWLATKKKTTSTEYANAMAVPNRTSLNHLKRFAGLGLLRKTGAGPATVYQVIRK